MGILTETLVCEDMTSCTDLARCHVVDEIATVLPSNSYYTVVASIFLISVASCKPICGVASIRNFRLFSAILAKVTCLLMPHVLIKYAHVSFA